MNEQDARRILAAFVTSDDRLEAADRYVSWPLYGDSKDRISLDDIFTADEIEAMAWWMRNK